MIKSPYPPFEEVRARLAALSIPHLKALQVFALLQRRVAPSDINFLAQRITKLGVGKNLTERSLQEIIGDLVTEGLLARMKQGTFAVGPVAEVAARMAGESGVAEGVLEWMPNVRLAGDTYPYSRRGANCRALLYAGDTEKLRQELEFYSMHDLDDGTDHPLLPAFTYYYDEEMASRVPDHDMQRVMVIGLEHAMWLSRPMPELCEAARRRCTQNGAPEGLARRVVEHALLCGDFDVARACAPPGSVTEFAVNGALLLLAGKLEEAGLAFDEALARQRKLTKKRRPVLDGMMGVFQVLALLGSGQPQTLKEVIDHVVKKPAEYMHFGAVIEGFIPAWSLLAGHTKVREQYTDGEEYVIGVLIMLWMAAWAEASKPQVNEVRRAVELFDRGGMKVLLAETLLAAQTVGLLPPDDAAAKELFSEIKTVPLLHLIRKEPEWERALKALARIAPDTPRVEEPAAPQKTERLSWRVEIEEESDWIRVAPFLQKRNKNGSWTGGRELALKGLLPGSGADPAYMTDHDRPVRRAVQRSRYSSYYSRPDYEINSHRAITELIGHPHVYWMEQPDVRIDIVRAEPELRVVEKNQKLVLEITPRPNREGEVVVTKDGPARVRVTVFRKEHYEIAKVIGNAGLTVPQEGAEKVRSAITPLAAFVTVHSDVGGGTSNAESIPADSRPHVMLVRHAEGLKGDIRVRPFGSAGPSFVPGEGGQTVLSFVDGKRLQTKRNLEEEFSRAHGLIRASEVLSGLGVEIGEEWVVDNPETSLELLLQLRGLGDEIVLEWTQGEKWRVAGEAGVKQFHIAIGKARDWFTAGGGVRIDDKRVVEMQQLLQLLGDSKSRFVHLGDGEFLAITSQLRKRLEELRSISDIRGDEVRLHPLAAIGVRALVEEAREAKLDKAWKDHIEKLDASMSVTPEVPSTLRAELRPYQVEGFQWMARLAAWGVGGCLADDMGLGKTVQAIALLLHRASDGPAFVVAPTSVGPNWQSELLRFAPTLRVHVFGIGNREEMLNRLGPFDVVIATYGLLYTEEEKLGAVKWSTVILDEAQAIKNIGARRSQAAMSLQAGFRLITTGTPIENHLSELWNLFRFINPGLLGSMESFNTRFANPIERLQDRHMRSALKRIIQPFILRRTKEQVLEELPPRTDILRVVEMEPEEQAFYESLRREALMRLDESKAEGGERHLQILAEIMKLRRACCNARLLRAELALPSAKLNEFRVILEELLENRHKALVFSQFVDHLKILREELDARGVAYQYLDGSTPQKERKVRVDAFQSGKGDVFLISLKAGGLGLNLTASDYVIHMDPWWNPAVEDQASDRAHRIGQKRPVTVYRVVTKGTIEERIVALHTHKRSLADTLLEGTDAPGKLKAEELVELLRGW